jgi:hypothetical protein
MARCEFVEEKFSSSAVVKGWTAFAEKADAPGKDTGVYLPPNHPFDKGTVDVVVWFHGFYVSDARDLMHPDGNKEMKLRDSVLRCGKDVVLVAPYLGPTGSLSLGPLGAGDGLQDYLAAVLDGLVRFRKSVSAGASPSLQLGSLILAGHSAGGAQMRDAAKHLGNLAGNLKECWGFDCFYDTLWPDWVKATPKPDKVIYFGNGSGGGGSHAFRMMKEVYGTPKKPLGDGQRPPNTYLAPAVDRVWTAKDDVAFQSVQDVTDWNPAGPNVYTDVRKATDQYLDDKDQSRYWGALFPRLTDHFQLVRDLFGPRLKQSRWLRAGS